MKTSLSRQLIISTGVIYLVGTLVFAWLVGYSQSTNLLEEEVKENQVFVKAIAVSIVNNLSKADISAVEHVLAEYMHLNKFDRISIVSPKNIILTELVHKKNDVINSFSYGQPYEALTPENDYQHEFSIDLEHSAKNLGKLYVQANFSQIKQLKHNIWLTIFVSGLCIYFLVMLVMVIKLNKTLTPLNKISDFTKDFISNMGTSVDIETDITEVNDMVQAVNWSSKKLKALEEDLRKQAETLETQVLKRTKELSMAKKAAESASDEKTRFLSHMSHELRTPLNSILGFSQILVLKPVNMTELQIESIKEIYNSGTHLLSLVNEILDISKIEEGALEVDISKVNVINFIKNFYNSIKNLAADNGISLALSIQVTGNEQLLADEKRLMQVMYNLVSNAIKYTHKGGLIVIKVTSENNSTKVEVIDTGIGIEEKDFPGVFSKFTRFDSSDHTEGAGIGLHLTKELVEIMNGEIGFSSEYDTGSRFWFTLPKHKS